MHRILYLSPRHSRPPLDKQKNMFYHLSRYFSGDLLAPTWFQKNSEGIKAIKEADLAMGNFQYHVTFSIKLPNLIKSFWDMFFYIFKGLYLHYFKEKYDVIITYGPFKTGIAGYLLKKLTGAKLIVRIPGNYKKAFLYESEKISFFKKVKHKMGNIIMPFIINHADHINLLYPNQLDGYINIKNNNQSVFHDFPPIKSVKLFEETEKYILFLGFPWYLKGVDILIKAFKLISDEFPEYRLKIVGFCPDKSYFKKLTEGNEKIELLDAVFHDEAMKLMSKCSLFVLPSRTEGIATVLMEAMAFKKPIIASNVDGTPHIIKHGFNGLLFESENVRDLADKMIIILNNPEYAAKLAENGHRYVNEQLSVDRFVECFNEMVKRVLACQEKR